MDARTHMLGVGDCRTGVLGDGEFRIGVLGVESCETDVLRVGDVEQVCWVPRAVERTYSELGMC